MQMMQAVEQYRERFEIWWEETSDYYYFFKENWKKLLIATIIAMSVLWSSIIWIMKTEEIATVSHVLPKQDTYFILTDKGAFRFESSFFFLQPEVADRIGSIHSEKTYKFTHYGVRIPILNMYENILDFEEITEDAYFQ